MGATVYEESIGTLKVNDFAVLIHHASRVDQAAHGTSINGKISEIPNGLPEMLGWKQAAIISSNSELAHPIPV